MPLVTRSRPQIGDVVEIATPKGMAYAHFTHRHDSPPKFGALLRVLPGLFDERPGEFDELVRQAPQFMTFFPLGAACRRGLVRVVANEAVSPQASTFPIFRASVQTPAGRGPWWLWDGQKEWRIGKLEPGMERLPIRSVINDTLLVQRIVGGWRHEHDT